LADLLTIPGILLFLLLVARATGLVLVAPLFGEAIVPARVKAMLTVALAVGMIAVAPPAPPSPTSLAELALLLVAEISVGLALGLVTRLFLLAFQMAGEIVAIQMALGMASLIDPVMGYRSNIMGRWMWMIGLALFLGLNGHHLLLRILATSLGTVPPGQGLLSDEVVRNVQVFTGESIRTALQIALPVVGVLLLTMLGLGILARTVPQMNVFIVGFPLKIAVGILAVGISMPFLVDVARHEITALAARLWTLVAAT
jgi:flagellar biosynthetic protein FliR